MTLLYNITPKKTSVPINEKIMLDNSPAAPARAAENYPHVLDGDPSYLDTIANLDFQCKSHNTIGCGRFAISGVCENGHRAAMVINCGREWCPRCGQQKSDAHKRRYGRLLPKVQQMRTMGLFTITFPEGERSKLRGKVELGNITKKVIQVMKSYGYKRGIIRWHWFGECSCSCGQVKKFGQWYDEAGKRAGIICPKCGKKDYYTTKNNYHPHLNLIIDAGKLEKNKLDNIKTSLRTSVNALVVHYGYSNKPGKMLHRIRYITRATFKAVAWDPELADILKGFRNIRCWGTRTRYFEGYWNGRIAWNLKDLKKEDRKDVEDIKEIETSYLKCPCGCNITWSNVILDCNSIPAELVKPFGGSGRYYLINCNIQE